MRKWLLLFNIIFFFCIISKAQTLQFKNFNTSDGLLSASVYDVFQDRKGFIWLPTVNGVNRFDGKTFESFTTENGLADIEILEIREDLEGRVWFLSFNGKLSYFLDGKIYNPDNTPLLKKAVLHSNVVDFFEDSRHNLWFSAGYAEVMCITFDNHIKYFKYDEEKAGLSSLIFYEDDFKNLYAINKSSFYEIKDYKFHLKSLPEKPLSNKCILIDKTTSSLFIINKNGLYKFQNEKEIFICKIPLDAIDKGISSFMVENDSIWLTILGNGIKKIDRKNGNEITYLENKYASSIIRDVRKNIWISTIDNGLYLLSKLATNFTHFTSQDLLSDEGVYSLIKDDQDRIWLGLRNGQIDVLFNDKPTVIDLKIEPLLYNPIKELWFDKKNNNIWFMNESWVGSLNSSNPKKPLVNFISSKNFSLKSFDFNSKGKMSLATATGLYFFEPKNMNQKNMVLNLDSFKQINGLRTFSVAYDVHDHLWFSQLDGLHIIKNNKIYSFSKKIKALNDRIVDIYCDENGLTYASTSSHGVCILKDDKILKVITTKDGLNSNNCIKTITYHDELWVLNSNGVNKITDPLGQIKITGYTINNGLLSNEVNDIIVDENFVYLATNKGLTRLNKKEEETYRPDLPIYFKKLVVSGKEHKITNDLISLAPKDNNIQISFTAINYENPAGVMFGYRIRTSDNWIETPNNYLEFASLEPGNYTIQIRAKDLYGNWGRSIELKIKIGTPFYDAAWFLILVIVLFIGLALLIYNQYLKRKRMIENQKIRNQSKIVTLEQQALQAMMNPHFIFNVMNSIQYFINTRDKTTANKLLTGFARLIRKNMDIVNKGQISLFEEIEYLKLYLQLESLRFGNKMNYEFDIDESIELEDIMIPSMLLQPFIENSIWHGIMPKEEKGNITISIHQNFQLIKIIIDDDGIGIDNSLKTKNDEYISRGMKITQERISLINQLSGTEMNIQIEQKKEGGTVVRINIPISY
jgi:ligand-binding sensor domain-containing protein